jgi:hypothetical protein
MFRYSFDLKKRKTMRLEHPVGAASTALVNSGKNTGNGTLPT